MAGSRLRRNERADNHHVLFNIRWKTSTNDDPKCIAIIVVTVKEHDALDFIRMDVTVVNFMASLLVIAMFQRSNL